MHAGFGQTCGVVIESGVVEVWPAREPQESVWMEVHGESGSFEIWLSPNAPQTIWGVLRSRRMYRFWDRRWKIDLYETGGRSRRLVKERAKTHGAALKRARQLKRLVAGNEINVNSPPAGSKRKSTSCRP